MSSFAAGARNEGAVSPSALFGKSEAAALSALTFCLLVALYVLTYSGAFRTDDEHLLAARSQSLAFWGDFSSPQLYGNDRIRALESLPFPQDVQASAIEPAQTALGATLFVLARKLQLGGVQAAFTLNIFVTALTAVVVLWTVRGMGYPLPTGLWCALAYGVGTWAWPNAKTFFRDPLAALMMATAFMGWVHLWRRRTTRDRLGWSLLIVGSVLGGMLAKNTAAVLVPSLLLASAFIYVLDPRLRKSALWGLGVSAAIVIVLVVGALVLQASGPLSRYTLPYLGGLARHFASQFNVELALAFLGPFVSPAKSIFVFSPLLLLAPLGAVRGWKENKPYLVASTLAVLTLALAQGLFYGDQWAGSTGYGLRYMLPAAPIMVAAAAPVFDLASRRGRGLLPWVVRPVLALSLLLQLAGALVDRRVAVGSLLAQGIHPSSVGSEWQPQALVIPATLRNLLNPAAWDVAWVRVLSISSSSILIPGCAVALLLAGALLLIRWLRRPNQAARRRVWLACGLVLAVSILPFYPSLYALREDPELAGDRPEYSRTLEWLEGHLDPGDIVAVDSYVTPLWKFMMNWWREPVAWYSLPFEIPSATDGLSGPPSAAVLDLFERILPKHDRLVYLSTSEAPDYGLGRKARWLDERFSLVASEQFVGQAIVDVRIYSLGDLPP